MRMSSIISEALRNLLSGTTRAGLLALAAGLAALALAVVDIATVAALQRQADTFHRSGASVQVLLAEGMVDPVSCDRLGQVPGVHGAGALRQRASITLSAVERNPIPAFDVTPGLRRLLAIPDAAGTGVWVSRDLAHTLGVSPSSSLATASGLMAIAGVYDWPEDGRDARLGFAILVPTQQADPFDECWADVWPSNPELDDVLRATTPASGSSKPVSKGLLNNNHGASFDGARLLAERPTRGVALGSIGFAFLLGTAAARQRRLEFASALHAGQRRVDQLAQVTLECLVWSVTAAILASAGIVAASHIIAPREPMVVALANLNGAWSVPAAALAGVVVGTLLTRESHLFRYFKDR